LAEMRWRPNLALRRRHHGTRIALDLVLAPEIPDERPGGGQLSCRGRARPAPLVEVGKEAAERRAIEVRRLHVGAPDAGERRGMIDELSEIALVRAHGVRRGVAIKREKLQERF